MKGFPAIQNNNFKTGKEKDVSNENPTLPLSESGMEKALTVDMANPAGIFSSDRSTEINVLNVTEQRP